MHLDNDVLPKLGALLSKPFLKSVADQKPNDAVGDIGRPRRALSRKVKSLGIYDGRKGNDAAHRHQGRGLHRYHSLLLTLSLSSFAGGALFTEFAELDDEELDSEDGDFTLSTHVRLASSSCNLNVSSPRIYLCGVCVCVCVCVLP